MKDSKTIINGYLKKSDWRVKENSNSPFSYGGLTKYIIGEVSKDYWLREVYPEYIAKEYIDGTMHIHDLSGLSVYCCGYSLKNIIITGVKGIPPIPTSSPAKHFDAILNQLANLITVFQNEIMGAVAFSSFDTLLAPFIKIDNLDYKKVKQALQNFVFSINSNSRGGAEPAFSNLSFDLFAPPDLADKFAVTGAGIADFKYKDCQSEIDMINRAFCELMIKGDANGRPFAYPIPSYNIIKGFNWDNPNNELLWEMAGKYGYPYFSNFINSDMKPEDTRSMALCGSQNLIFQNSNGVVTTNEIRNLVSTWNSLIDKPKYKMLMNGKFVDVIDMFEVPYTQYDKYINIKLQNGYKQNFSMHHKCYVYDNKEFKIIESQNLTSNMNFVISSKSWGINNGVGTYESGKILGYYLAEGWFDTHSDNQICFAINIEKSDIAFEIEAYFKNNGCVVKIDKQEDKQMYRVSVYGKQGVGFVKQFIRGKTAITKRLNYPMWNTSDEFRRGVFDGYLATDGCKKHDIFAHTTNKKIIQDFIVLASSIGQILKFRENKSNTRYFKEDKNDKISFTSYELKIMSEKYEKVDDFYIVPIEEVSFLNSETNTMYNFTVDTKDHLFELPNGIISEQCCRLRLDLSELQKRNGGLFGSGDSTGSIGVVTINLPQIAYKAKGNKEAFYTELDRVLNIAKDSLEIKREWLTENILNTGAIPAFKAYVGTFRNHFSTIGVVGMSEMCENFFGEGINILCDEGKNFAVEVGKYIRNQLLKFQKETGNLYNFEATPAESTAYRLALKDKGNYPDIITRGTNRVPYYTNSCHIPVNQIKGIKETFDNQEELQVLFTGGTVIHIYVNSAISGETAKSIVKTVCENYKVPYVSISPLNRYCPEHGYIADNVDNCPVCHREVQKFQRITGYLRCVDNFNDGKKAEFIERVQLNIK